MNLFGIALFSIVLVAGAQDNPARSSPSSASEDSRGRLYRVGGGVKAPRVISSPQPNYPQDARKGHAAGTIVIGLIVGSDGQIQDTKVQRGISPELDQAAVDAVKMWKYDPATKDGKPVRVQIAVEFDLQP
jgi:periplasmic protein TonB